MKKLLILFFLVSNLSISQIGGNSSFSFLNRSFSAKTLALGNSYISNQDEDPNDGVCSPALLNESNSNHFSFNQLIQIGGVFLGMLNYTRKNDLLKGNQSISLRYVDYGKMKETSQEGTILGDFTPADFILSSGLSKKLNSHFNLGLQINFLASFYNQKGIFGSSVDFGGIYKLNDTTQSFSFLIKNIGVQFNSFYNEPKNLLPIDLQIAYSHKLKHAPFRFSYLFQKLNKWDLSYYDPTIKPTIDPLTGESVTVKKATFIQKTAMHFLPQVEMLIGKNIKLRVAFDYFRRYQMAITNRPGISGFSFGLGLNFKRFSMDYGMSSYSAAGTIHGVSLTSSFSQWRKKSTL